MNKRDLLLEVSGMSERPVETEFNISSQNIEYLDYARPPNMKVLFLRTADEGNMLANGDHIRIEFTEDPRFGGGKSMGPEEFKVAHKILMELGVI